MVSTGDLCCTERRGRVAQIKRDVKDTSIHYCDLLVSVKYKHWAVAMLKWVISTVMFSACRSVWFTHIDQLQVHGHALYWHILNSI